MLHQPPENIIKLFERKEADLKKFENAIAGLTQRYIDYYIKKDKVLNFFAEDLAEDEKNARIIQGAWYKYRHESRILSERAKSKPQRSL